MFSKKEIYLLAFILGGLTLGFGISSVFREEVSGFPPPETVAVPEDASDEGGEVAAKSSARDKDASAENEAADFEGPVNINQAGLSELTSLNGIGEVIGGRIIEEREDNGLFSSPDDLKRVSGIGPKTVEKNRDRIVCK